MARRFFFVSLGILALSLVYQIGTERGRAGWDPSVSGLVVGTTEDGYAVWNRLGEAYLLSSFTPPIHTGVGSEKDGPCFPEILAPWAGLRSDS
jgi:hypothetical protein